MNATTTIITPGVSAPRGAANLKTPMILKVWGTTEANQAKAHAEAARGWSRKDWEFIDIKYLDGPHNPLNNEFGHAIAADSGDGWAYAAHRAA